MARRFVLGVALFFMAQISGASIVVWLDNNPAGLSPGFFIEKIQHSIRVLTVPLPALAAVGLLFTLAATIQARRERLRFYLLIAASACVIAGAVSTGLGSVPINEQILTWSSASPPSNWAEVIEKWRLFHLVRTVLTMTGLCFLILAVLERSDAAAQLAG